MKDDLLKLEHQLCFRLYALSRNMTRLYQPLLEAYNLTYPQYIILLILWEEDHMDFKVLSNRVDLKTGTLTPILQKMEENGFIQRIKNPSDARRITISLTPRGSDLKAEIVQVPVKLTQLLNMTPTQYYETIKILDTLSQQLNDAQQQLMLNPNNENY